MKMRLFVSVWLTVSCLLFSASSLSTSSQKYLTLALLFSLSSVSSPGRHFILHAADHSSSNVSFLPHPHLPFLLTSDCSSSVPLSTLCTALECMWVSQASIAPQISDLAAFHPGCCRHATRHHSQKGGSKKMQYCWKPPGCGICLS